MKWKILSKKGAALALAVMLAVGSFAVSASEVLDGVSFTTATYGASNQGGSGDTNQGDTNQGDTDQGDTEAPEPTETPEVEAESVTLSQTVLTLKEGETAKLTATVKPDNAADKTVTWSTDNAAVATVAGGTVTAKAEGTATITVSTVNGKTAACAVTVKKNIVNPTGIRLSQTGLSLKAGQTAVLTATVAPENATDKTVAWTSDNTGVATVANGTVTAVANGTATITAATVNGKTATCTVTVTTDVESVTLDQTEAIVGKGTTLTLKAVINPSTASDKSLTWVSSNEKVATVDQNGTVTGVKAGTADITVKAANDKSAVCKVTVSSVTLNAKTVPLQVKKSTTALKATVSAKGDSVESWKSSNTKVVKVNSKGKLTATSKTGKATVTVTTKSGAKASCTVKVQKGKVTAKSISLSSTKMTLLKGKSATLTVTRNPISATEKITWSSSDKKVATVNSKGKVTAKKAGKATITAKTSNGKKATCKVTVKNATVKLVKTSGTVKVGQSLQIKIKSTFPKDDKVKSYKSSNKKVATVDKNGKVTGKKKGTAKITVTMKSGAKATFKVTVKK